MSRQTWSNTFTRSFGERGLSFAATTPGAANRRIVKINENIGLRVDPLRSLKLRNFMICLNRPAPVWQIGVFAVYLALPWDCCLDVEFESNWHADSSAPQVYHSASAPNRPVFH